LAIGIEDIKLNGPDKSFEVLAGGGTVRQHPQNIIFPDPYCKEEIYEVVYYDFPYWIRFAHFINLIFITLLIRSGVEILSALPKLYWHDHATPGTEWIKFTKKVFPPNLEKRVWISLEEEESFSSWIALPGHKNLGMGRHWHFFSIIFWIANGVAYIHAYHLNIVFSIMCIE
jgi:hypothetical protein